MKQLCVLSQVPCAKTLVILLKRWGDYHLDKNYLIFKVYLLRLSSSLQLLSANTQLHRGFLQIISQKTRLMGRSIDYPVREFHLGKILLLPCIWNLNLLSLIVQGNTCTFSLIFHTGVIGCSLAHQFLFYTFKMSFPTVHCLLNYNIDQTMKNMGRHDDRTKRKCMDIPSPWALRWSYVIYEPSCKTTSLFLWHTHKR